MCDPFRYGQLRLSCSFPFPVENSNSPSAESANSKSKNERDEKQYRNDEIFERIWQARFEKSQRERKKDLADIVDIAMIYNLSRGMQLARILSVSPRLNIVNYTFREKGLTEPVK